ncbi:DUF2948 family protein [Glacieibacterium sp.]|uniref:DUF2948 family protein n=1 Tax=Glacieibacterium sp. TaxID=2860237 RepID=UPI003AFFCE5B
MVEETLADTRLLLLAQDPDEVPLLSALCIGAVLPVVEAGYDRRARRLVLMLRRYRWEADVPSRILTALRIDCVLDLQRRKWPVAPAVLELLAFTQDGDVLTFDFAGGATLRATVECADMVLEDLGAPWEVRKPDHG